MNRRRDFRFGQNREQRNVIARRNDKFDGERAKNEKLQRKIYEKSLGTIPKDWTFTPFAGSVGEKVQLTVNCLKLVTKERKVFVYEIKIVGPQKQMTKAETMMFRREVFWSYVEPRLNDPRLFDFGYESIVFDDIEHVFTTKPFMKLETPNDSRNVDYAYRGTLGVFDVELMFKLKKVAQIEDSENNPNAVSSPLIVTIIRNCLTQHMRIPEHQARATGWFGQGSQLIKLHSINEPNLEVSNFTDLVRGLLIKVNIGTNGRPYLNAGLINRVIIKADIDMIEYYAMSINNQRLSQEDWENLKRRECGMVDSQARDFDRYMKGVRVRTKNGEIFEHTFEALARQGNKLMTAKSTHVRCKNGELISVAEMYRQRGQPLLFPNFPLMKVKGLRGCVPMEHYKLPRRLQSAQNKLFGAAISRVIQQATILPRDLFYKTKQFLEEANIGSTTQIPEAPQPTAFGITIKNEMMKIEGRVLPDPNTHHSFSSNSLSVKKVFKPCSPFHLIACKRDYPYERDKIEFLGNLKTVGYEMGLDFLEHYKVTCPSYSLESLEDVEKYMSNEQRAAQRDFDQIQFLFFTDGSPNLYKWIKVCGDLKFGVSTQCVNAFKLDLVDKKDRLQMIQNLVKKVCERRDGLLHAINRECLNELPSKTTEAFIRYTTTENTTMFVGIFSTKSDDRIKVMTSNVGVSTLSSSFNADIECTKFWSRFEFTTNGNNINKLEELMYKTFLAFYEHNQCFPDNVFLYRGSMSESAAEEMAPDEIKAISDAWSKLVKDKQKNKTLKLLYVTVERRHKIRLIKSVVSRNSDPSKANVDKGTVVDQIITSPKGNDFYLCSHEGLKGTSKPAHYIIQYSNWDKLDPNDIQLITYCLCYLLARSVTPISVPTPVYYAQLMCKRLRDYMGVIEWKDVKVHPRLINKNFIT